VVRIRVGKVPKWHQVGVLCGPFIIEGADIDQCLDLSVIIYSEQIAKRRVTGLLRINCHYGVEAEIPAVAKDRESTDTEKLAFFGIANVGETGNDCPNVRPNSHRIQDFDNRAVNGLVACLCHKELTAGAKRQPTRA